MALSTEDRPSGNNRKENRREKRDRVMAEAREEADSSENTEQLGNRKDYPSGKTPQNLIADHPDPEIHDAPNTEAGTEDDDKDRSKSDDDSGDSGDGDESDSKASSTKPSTTATRRKKSS